jgi:hypothetical protein
LRLLEIFVRNLKKHSDWRSERVEEELEWWLRVEIKKIDGVWRDDRLWFTYLCREVANSLRFV